MQNQSKQKGTVLAISLIILLVMTVLVVSSLRSATMEEQMSGNSFDKALAFQAAESALRAGERFLDTDSTPFLDEACTAGVCTNTRKQTVTGWIGDPTSSVWNNAKTVDVTLNGVRTIARYMIEDMCEFDHTDPDTGLTSIQRMFRVTAYATGGTNSSRVMLQSTYAIANPGYGVNNACDCVQADYCGPLCSSNINCTL